MNANRKPVRIAIFASGNGTNARCLMQHFRESEIARIALVVTNNANAGVIEKAKSENVPVQILTGSSWQQPDAILLLLEKNNIQMLVLAGYLKMVPPEVIAQFRGRILNIHPALLPDFGGKGMFGKNVHEAVLKAKEKISGISVHHVTEAYDEGTPILQSILRIQEGWSATQLETAIHELEHRHFPFAVERFCKDLNESGKTNLSGLKKIESALVSVFHKDGLDEIIRALHANGVKLYSTGGTADHIRNIGIPVTDVSDITGYPSILDGRVKTLHPSVFGGILARRDVASHILEAEEHNIPMIDLVIVDLYPFEKTLASGAEHSAIIEKIDIGGISLIRAAAKNHADVAIVPAKEFYDSFLQTFKAGKGYLSLQERKKLAGEAFRVSSHYDNRIGEYLREESGEISLRYGENPHQIGSFHGNLSAVFEQLHGKEISYNNLVDVDAALEITAEFHQPVFAIIKHTNPCGLATGENLETAWKRALECDPLSAFGGVLSTNQKIDRETAVLIDEIFFEVLIAPEFDATAFEVLSKKKNRILLKKSVLELPLQSRKSVLNGMLVQDKDRKLTSPETWEVKTTRKPSGAEQKDILFGEIAVKHLKSNAIALVKEGMLIGSGMGQTSRVDALKQAIAKAKERGFDPAGSVLASDAFLPFSDSAGFAYENGVEVILQPGGSVRDQETIDFCEQKGMCLVFTGIRHFRH